jgi:MoxR-like ATPase
VRAPEGSLAVVHEERLERAALVVRRLRENVETVVHGKTREIELVLAALACGGHVLLEDVPGTAKTVLARSIAQSIEGAVAARIQCTPDLQPTDVTGLEVYDPRTREFEFRPGPLFANVVLVDEVNRAMPKTQSALLEAMAETQVTVGGATRPLPRPFLVLATENPVEQEGTFTLPEAQLDRFFLKTALGYPHFEVERAIVEEQRSGHPLAGLRAAVAVEELVAVAEAVEDVYIDRVVLDWLLQLVRATRDLDGVALGASVRGSLALERAVRAWALVRGRSFVVPEDVEELFLPVVAHRVLFTPGFLVELRREGAAARDRFFELCLAAAPRPEPAPVRPLPAG